jgi:hypothetical protein
MLIDTGHRRWMIGTGIVAVILIGLYVWLDRTAIHPLTGGTPAGLWYGVGGTLLMVYAGLLSAHRRLARWPYLPRRAWMLKGHIWLGLLSFVLILCHSGFRWGGSLEMVLWLTFGAVVVSGIVGLVLQNVLPRLITLQVTEETPYEQIPHVCRQLAWRAAQLTDEICRPGNDAAPGMARVQVGEYYKTALAPFLAGTAGGKSTVLDSARTRERFAEFLALPDLAPARENLRQLEQLCEQRRQIAIQEQLHHWLHGWLLVHIPFSLALLVLAAAHIVMSLYY